MKRGCAVHGCNEQHDARGLCHKHYKVAARAGMLPEKLTINDRLKKYSKKNHETGCVEWMRYRDIGGYGIISANGHPVPTHRAAWEDANGKIPNGMLVLHKCDNPPCINPDHLFLGTQIDNIADMDTKGRRDNQRGERNGRAKLTENKVKEIRCDKRLQKEIAANYGVSLTVINLIKLGKSWTHI